MTAADLIAIVERLNQASRDDRPCEPPRWLTFADWESGYRLRATQRRNLKRMIRRRLGKAVI